MVAPRRRLRRIAAALAGPLPPAAPVAKEEAKPEEEEEGWESAAKPAPLREANPLLPPRTSRPETDVADGLPDTRVPELTERDVAQFKEHGSAPTLSPPLPDDPSAARAAADG